jgi:hypothetical protein
MDCFSEDREQADRDHAKCEREHGRVPVTVEHR